LVYLAGQKLPGLGAVLAYRVDCDLDRDSAGADERMHIRFGVREDEIVFDVGPTAVNERRYFLRIQAHPEEPLKAACRFKRA